ncbi:hypothetical protein DL771_009641 [Monosporascus sp. 5C6A]|nr:hypothetical protein DL771_009641 [Monosporascus sp. 5C6A]
MANTVLLSTLALFTGIASATPVRSQAARVQERQSYAVAPEGYFNEVFLDDFSAGAIDTNIWQYDLGTSYPGGAPNWGTGEIQTYTNDPSNIHVNEEGVLVITPRNDNGHWTSARIETTSNVKVACPEGGKLWVEVNVKVGSPNMPQGEEMGIWPAFWMMGSDYRGNYWNWPSIGEIDILETANGDSTIYHTVHCDEAPGGTCNEFNGIGSAGMPFSRGEWHKVSVEIDRTNTDWAQQAIRFFVDRELRWELTPQRLNYDQAAWEALAVNDKMILLNVAVGGGFPNGISGETTPNSRTRDGEDVDMEVDYVVAWTT